MFHDLGKLSKTKSLIRNWRILVVTISTILIGLLSALCYIPVYSGSEMQVEYGEAVEFNPELRIENQSRELLHDFIVFNETTFSEDGQWDFGDGASLGITVPPRVITTPDRELRLYLNDESTGWEQKAYISIWDVTTVHLSLNLTCYSGRALVTATGYFDYLPPVSEEIEIQSSESAEILLEIPITDLRFIAPEAPVGQWLTEVWSVIRFEGYGEVVLGIHSITLQGTSEDGVVPIQVAFRSCNGWDLFDDGRRACWEPRAQLNMTHLGRNEYSLIKNLHNKTIFLAPCEVTATSAALPRGGYYVTRTYSINQTHSSSLIVTYPALRVFYEIQPVLSSYELRILISTSWESNNRFWFTSQDYIGKHHISVLSMRFGFWIYARPGRTCLGRTVFRNGLEVNGTHDVHLKVTLHGVSVLGLFLEPSLLPPFLFLWFIMIFFIVFGYHWGVKRSAEDIIQDPLIIPVIVSLVSLFLPWTQSYPRPGVSESFIPALGMNVEWGDNSIGTQVSLTSYWPECLPFTGLVLLLSILGFWIPLMFFTNLLYKQGRKSRRIRAFFQHQVVYVVFVTLFSTALLLSFDTIPFIGLFVFASSVPLTWLIRRRTEKERHSEDVDR